MRNLKYAILGLMNEKPRTGYDLTLEFESTLNEFWSARHSQIYPELNKLTEEGDLTYEDLPSDKGPARKLYTITPKGRREFLEWLRTDEPSIPTPKDPFRLRVFFLSCLSGNERLELLAKHRVYHAERLLHLKKNQEKFPGLPAKDSPEFGDYLVLLGAIMREENFIQWIDSCIRLLKP